MAATRHDDPKLPDVDATQTAAPAFQIQTWHDGDGWAPMRANVAGSRPRTAAFQAVATCIAWTGGIGIPAMQVVDLASGEPVWRDSREYPDAGPSIALPEDQQRLAHDCARAILDRDDARRATAPPDQLDLW